MWPTARCSAALLVLAVIRAGYVLVPVSKSFISQANCDKIHVGWTEAQVEQLLGNDPLKLSLGGRHSFWHDEDGNEIRVSPAALFAVGRPGYNRPYDRAS
jgi:hypothetical protein